MVSRAFIIICIYNHSIIISVIKRTGEDKDNIPFLRPVFHYHTVHLQQSTFASSNTLCLRNSKTVSSLVFCFCFFLVFSSSFYLVFSCFTFFWFLTFFFFFVVACFVLHCWFRFLFPSFSFSFFFFGGVGIGSFSSSLFFYFLNLSCMQTYDFT